MFSTLIRLINNKKLKETGRNIAIIEIEKNLNKRTIEANDNKALLTIFLYTGLLTTVKQVSEIEYQVRIPNKKALN